MNPRLILPLAVVLLVLGMVLVIAGVIVPALFYPGVYVIALGMIGVAAAGIVRVTRPA